MSAPRLGSPGGAESDKRTPASEPAWLLPAYADARLRRRDLPDGGLERSHSYRTRAGVVDLVHRLAPALEPVELTELRIAVAVRVLLQVLQVQQLARDAGLVPLGVQARRSRARADGAWAAAARTGGSRAPVAECLDLGPVQPSGARPALDAGDGAQAGPSCPATSRWLRPRVRFCRRISWICRMESRSAAIPPLSASGRTARTSQRRCRRRPPPLGSRVAGS
jgi:hypothetical protein